MAPALAAAIQIIPPTTSTMGSYVFPLHPMPINTRQVAITVAIVIPLTGLLLEPIMPTIREETVTKKAPNTTTKTPNNNLFKIPSPGIIGIKAISRIKPMLPKTTTFIGKSLSVLLAVSFETVFSLMEPTLSLKEETMVGMVLSKVIKPPAATAPAPTCLM